jgi:hypothetical protein
LFFKLSVVTGTAGEITGLTSFGSTIYNSEQTFKNVWFPLQQTPQW